MAIANATSRVLAVGSVTGDKVRNRAGEDLGNIEDIMIDLQSGRIAYAVLTFGGFLGMGDKLFAVPWKSLELNSEEHEFILDVDKSTLENAPGFDKNNWPDFADATFGSAIHAHYGQEPYWEKNQYARPLTTSVRGSSTETLGEEVTDQDVSRERMNQPDLPEELRRPSH